MIGAAPEARRISSETVDPTLPRKEPTGRNGRLSAETISSPSKNAGRMRGCALDDPRYESAPLTVGIGEHANSRIGDLPSGEDSLKAAMLERARENIRELVMGGFLWGVIVSVGRPKFRQHGVDDRPPHLPASARTPHQGGSGTRCSCQSRPLRWGS